MQEPLILDRYRPLETKGEGGSGAVDICWDNRIHRRVAIKRLPIRDLGHAGTIPGLAEARTAAMLNHPAIVSVLDFDATDTEALLIMEAIEGPSLGMLLDENPDGLDLDIVTSVAASVGSALDFAHENQVLHLDIKPDNILIDLSGHVKVSDFGISELADAQGFGEASGGTIGYMPPEQMLGMELDQRCDGFSFAMVIYEMLTGANPFWAPDIDQSLDLIRRAEIEPPSALREDVDEELDEVLLKMLSPDRADRYETVLDFMDALMPLMGDRDSGTAKLRELVAIDDEYDEHEGLVRDHIGLWDRFSPRNRLIAGNAASAVLCWWIAALGIVAFDMIETPIAMAVALIAAVVAAFAPGFGAILALGTLSAGMIYDPSIGPLFGIGLLVIALIWWLFMGHEGASDINCALVVAPLGLVFLTPLAFLIAGFCLPPKRALGAAIMSSMLALALSVATGSNSLLHFGLALVQGGSGIQIMQTTIADGASWIIIGGWVLSAVFMSALCSRATRLSSIIGTCIATCLMFGMQFVVQWFTGGSWAAPDPAWSISVIFAGVLMVVIGALGAPHRSKGED